MTAERAINKQPPIVSAELSVTEAIATLYGSQVGCVLVVKQQQLIGLFTEQDVVRLVASKTNWEGLSVADAMSANLTTLGLTEITDLASLLSLMNQQQISYLPIVADDNRIVGLITVKTLSEALQVQAEETQNFEAELRVNEQALRLNQDRLDSILGSIEDVVWSADPRKFQLLYLNAATEKIYGRTVSEFLSNFNLRRDVIAPQDREQVERASKTLYSKGVQDIEYRIVRPNGEVRWVRDRARLILDAQGTPTRIDGIITDITERKQAQEKLRHDALHDGLTGLANRTLLMERLRQAIERSKSQMDKRFALLFLDLDGFKVVNDSLGHLVGDRLLIEVSQRLKSCQRTGDIIARHGGDEFAVLLEELPDVDDAIKVAQRLQQALKPPLVLDNREVFVSASIGIAIGGQANFYTSYDRVAHLLRDADTAMYYAKAKGQGGYEVFTPSMHTQIVQRLELESDLRRAIEREEFLIYYQPIICLSTNKIWGFEALVRWQHPLRGLVGPTEFIPLAEETGLSIAIDRWVMRSACHQLRFWQEQLPHSFPLTVSVNLSGKQFSQPGLVESLDQVLLETGIDGSYLKLEITESVVIDKAESTLTVLQQLRKRNVQLCLDDFGTGYSSLSYLHSFPFSVLKIDRSFISRLGIGGGNGEIVKAIIDLGTNLGMSVVAEGIETREQLTKLKSLNCAYGQGYRFAKPMSREAATSFVRNWSMRNPLIEFART